jgi:hypothetical protein
MPSCQTESTPQAESSSLPSEAIFASTRSLDDKRRTPTVRHPSVSAQINPRKPSESAPSRRPVTVDLSVADCRLLPELHGLACHAMLPAVR